MCINFIIFLYDVKEIVDLCTNFIVSSGRERDCGHVY